MLRGASAILDFTLGRDAYPPVHYVDITITRHVPYFDPTVTLAIYLYSFFSGFFTFSIFRLAEV